DSKAPSSPAPDATDPPDAQDAHLVAGLVERADALFGRGFPVSVELVGPDGLFTTLPAGPSMQSAGPPNGADPAAMRLVLSRVARVRPGAARLNAVASCAELTSPARTAGLAVCQQSLEPGETWVALSRPAGGRVSVLGYLPAGVPAAELSGLLVDEWTEV